MVSFLLLSHRLLVFGLCDACETVVSDLLIDVSAGCVSNLKPCHINLNCDNRIHGEASHLLAAAYPCTAQVAFITMTKGMQVRVRHGRCHLWQSDFGASGSSRLVGCIAVRTPRLALHDIMHRVRLHKASVVALGASRLGNG